MKNNELAEMLGGILSQIAREPEINFVRLAGEHDQETSVIDRRHVIGYLSMRAQGTSTVILPSSWQIMLSSGQSVFAHGYSESDLVAILGIDHVAEFDPNYPHK